MTERTETMYELEIVLLADGGVNLEQGANSGSGVQYVSLHRAQVRLLAEMVGLIAAAAPDQATPSVPEMQRTIVRLQRALLMAKLQAEELASDLALVADHGHEVLDAQIALARSMEDFLHFVCEDFAALAVDVPVLSAPPKPPSNPSPKATPKPSPNPTFGAAPGPLFAEDGGVQP